MTRPSLIEAPAVSVRPSRPIFARATGREFRADSKSIDLFDEIGPWGITAKEFRQELMRAGDVTVRINSPGGEVMDGLAMYNLLVQHEGAVRVEIIGLAASIASIITMAGDEIVIAENAHFMVHNSWTVLAGSEADFTDASQLLRQIDGSLAKTYAARTGRPETAMRAMMKAETWMTGEQAVEAGFADTVTESKKAKAAFDLSVFARVPEALKGEITNDEITIRDLESILREAGLSKSKARSLATRGHQGDADDRRDAAALAELAAHISAAASTITI